MADDTFAGPVNYLVFGFPQSTSVGEGLAAVLDRVDEGIIEILDLEVLTTDDSGAIATMALADLQSTTTVDLSVFDGALSNVLDEDDLATIADSLEPGSIAIALVYEDRSLARASAQWVQAGGTELLAGGVDIEDLAAVLDRKA